MIQPQILVQTYFVQTDVTLIHWLNEISLGPHNLFLLIYIFIQPMN